MKKFIDLRELLNSWPYDPEEDARIVSVGDGREVIQVRTLMGIEQYELDGRPDGERPHGVESVLEHVLQRLEKARAAGKEDSFRLDARHCAELFNEGTLYYFRYVRLFQLKDWRRTVRDTERNIRVFDLVRNYAGREEDRNFLEKWRPYIVRVHCSASAMLALEQGAYERAIREVKDGLGRLESLGDTDEDTFRFEKERSIRALGELLTQIETKRPLSEVEILEKQLKTAIERQEFEQAAVLRDRIRILRSQHTC